MAIASMCVVFSEESMPSITTKGALFGLDVLGNRRLEGFINNSNPCWRFHCLIRSDHSINIERTVLSPEAIPNFSVLSQKSSSP